MPKALFVTNRFLRHLGCKGEAGSDELDWMVMPMAPHFTEV